MKRTPREYTTPGHCWWSAASQRLQMMRTTLLGRIGRFKTMALTWSRL
jgi:hypothetical protein